MTLSPTWNVTFPPLQVVGGRTGLVPGTALESIAHLPHCGNEKGPKTMRFWHFGPAERPLGDAGLPQIIWLSDRASGTCAGYPNRRRMSLSNNSSTARRIPSLPARFHATVA